MRLPSSPAAHGRAAQVVESGPDGVPRHRGLTALNCPPARKTFLLRRLTPELRQPATEGGAGTPEGCPRRPGLAARAAVLGLTTPGAAGGPVALAVQEQVVARVDDAVEHRFAHHGVREQRVPVRR